MWFVCVVLVVLVAADAAVGADCDVCVVAVGVVDGDDVAIVEFTVAVRVACCC